MAHALLAPSSASRWLACTPSARLEADFPDRAGQAAEEGTLAHRLGEAKIRLAAKMISKAEYNKTHKAIQADALYQPEMEDYTDDYTAFVMERFAEAKARTADARLFVETKLDLTEFVPEGFGTGDICIVADHTADLIDLKYGKGVEVSAFENKQMMLYALGLLMEFDIMFDIHNIRMTIYQPRIDNVSEWEIAVQDLMDWADRELKPRAAMAFAGEGEFAPGKHCQFCRARVTCRANAEYQLQIAAYEFKAPLLLQDEEISDVLTRAASFANWLHEVMDYALEQAVNNGKKWPGMKLVEGRSNRTYTDAEKVAAALTKAGFPEDKIWQPREIYGITAMEKNIGKKTFADLLSPLVVKPQGKPTLVPQDDKRPELNGIEKAVADFATPLED